MRRTFCRPHTASALADPPGLAVEGLRWVIDADVEACFDTIDHKHLRDFLDLRIRDGIVRRMIDKWLKAGVLDKGVLRRSEAGVPQGWLNDFAVPGSSRWMRTFRRRLQRLWMRALRRRSQRDRFDWKRLERMTDILWPRATIRHPWPNQRFTVKHPREEPDGLTSMSGSVRGEPGNRLPYRDWGTGRGNNPRLPGPCGENAVS